MKNLGLYLHIPFCESKCYYCDFVSFRKTTEDKLKYVHSLINEIEYKSNKLKEYEIDTIFIGGGTPSCMPKGSFIEIFNKLRMSLNINKNCEITIEANPNTITKDFLNEIKECGVNRISIGLQSSNDSLLKQINRIHTKQDFLNAIDLIKKYDFKNINVDLMIGLPNQTLNDVKDSIELVKDKVTHISCYGLILEENTKLYDMVLSKQVSLPSEEDSNKMYDLAYKLLKKYGFERYEVSNFAKYGYMCKHNLKYWGRVEYIGLGLNASSFIDNKRYSNEINFNKYLKDFDDINNIDFEQLNYEELSKNDEINELIMLNLRTKFGLDVNLLKDKYNYDILQNKQVQIDKLIKNKLIEMKDNCIVVTNQGYYVLNQIILELMLDE